MIALQILATGIVIAGYIGWSWKQRAGFGITKDEPECSSSPT